MVRAQRKQPGPNRGGMAFGRNLMVLGSLNLALGLWGTVEGALTLGWPRAEATVTTADLLRQVTTSRVMALAGLWVRRKASQGIGTMNEEGATEDIAKAMRDGNPMP